MCEFMFLFSLLWLSAFGREETNFFTTKNEKCSIKQTEGKEYYLVECAPSVSSTEVVPVTPDSILKFEDGTNLINLSKTKGAVYKTGQVCLNERCSIVHFLFKKRLQISKYPLPKYIMFADFLGQTYKLNCDQITENESVDCRLRENVPKNLPVQLFVEATDDGFVGNNPVRLQTGHVDQTLHLKEKSGVAFRADDSLKHLYITNTDRTAVTLLNLSMNFGPSTFPHIYQLELLCKNKHCLLEPSFHPERTVYTLKADRKHLDALKLKLTAADPTKTQFELSRPTDKDIPSLDTVTTDGNSTIISLKDLFSKNKQPIVIKTKNGDNGMNYIFHVSDKLKSPIIKGISVFGGQLDRPFNAEDSSKPYVITSDTPSGWIGFSGLEFDKTLNPKIYVEGYEKQGIDNKPLLPQFKLKSGDTKQIRLCSQENDKDTLSQKYEFVLKRPLIMPSNISQNWQSMSGLLGHPARDTLTNWKKKTIRWVALSSSVMSASRAYTFLANTKFSQWIGFTKSYVGATDHWSFDLWKFNFGIFSRFIPSRVLKLPQEFYEPGVQRLDILFDNATNEALLEKLEANYFNILSLKGLVETLTFIVLAFPILAWLHLILYKGMKSSREHLRWFYPIRLWLFLLDYAFVLWLQAAVNIPVLSKAVMMETGKPVVLEVLGLFNIPCHGLLLGLCLTVTPVLFVLYGLLLLSRNRRNILIYDKETGRYQDRTVIEAKAFWKPLGNLPVLGHFFTVEVPSALPIVSLSGHQINFMPYDGVQAEAQRKKEEELPLFNSLSKEKFDTMLEKGSAEIHCLMDKESFQSKSYSKKVENCQRYSEAIVAWKRNCIKSSYRDPLLVNFAVKLGDLKTVMGLTHDDKQRDIYVPREGLQMQCRDSLSNIIAYGGYKNLYYWCLERVTSMALIVTTPLLIGPAAKAGFKRWISLCVCVTGVVTVCLLNLRAARAAGQIKWQHLQENSMRRDREEAKAKEKEDKRFDVWPFKDPVIREQYTVLRKRQENKSFRQFKKCVGVWKSIISLPQKSKLVCTLGEIAKHPAGVPEMLKGVICLVLAYTNLDYFGLICIGLLCLNYEASKLFFVDLLRFGRDFQIYMMTLGATCVNAFRSLSVLRRRLLFIGKQLRILCCGKSNVVSFIYTGFQDDVVRDLSCESITEIMPQYGLSLDGNLIYQEERNIKSPGAALRQPREMKLQKLLVKSGTLGVCRSGLYNKFPMAKDNNTNVNKQSLENLVGTVQIVNHNGLRYVPNRRHKEEDDSFYSFYFAPGVFPSVGNVSVADKSQGYAVKLDKVLKTVTIRGPAIYAGQAYRVKLEATNIEDESLSARREVSAEAECFCEIPGELVVKVPKNCQPNLQEEIVIELPEGRGREKVDPTVTAVSYASQGAHSSSMVIRTRVALINREHPYKVVWRLKKNGRPSSQIIEGEALPTQRGVIVLAVPKEEDLDGLDLGECVLTMKPVGARKSEEIRVECAETNRYEVHVCNNTWVEKEATWFSVCQSKMSHWYDSLVGRKLTPLEFLMVEERVPCTVVQCVDPSTEKYRVEPDFGESLKRINARLEKIEALRLQTQQLHNLEAVWPEVMSKGEVRSFWRNRGVEASTLEEDKDMFEDPLRQLQAFIRGGRDMGARTRELMKSGEFALRQELTRRLELVTQDLKRMFDRHSIWFKAYMDAELYGAQADLDAAYYAGLENQGLKQRVRLLKLGYQRVLKEFVYPLIVERRVLREASVGWDEQLLKWDSEFKNWLKTQENGDPILTTVLATDVSRALRYIIHRPEDLRRGRGRTILHYVISSSSLRSSNICWNADPLGAVMLDGSDKKFGGPVFVKLNPRYMSFTTPSQGYDTTRQLPLAYVNRIEVPKKGVVMVYTDDVVALKELLPDCMKSNVTSVSSGGEGVLVMSLDSDSWNRWASVISVSGLDKSGIFVPWKSEEAIGALDALQKFKGEEDMLVSPSTKMEEWPPAQEEETLSPSRSSSSSLEKDVSPIMREESESRNLIDTIEEEDESKKLMQQALTGVLDVCYKDWRYTGDGELNDKREQKVYEGEWIDSERSGRGVCLFKRGDNIWRYEGGFWKDEFSGRGKVMLLTSSMMNKSSLSGVSPPALCSYRQDAIVSYEGTFRMGEMQRRGSYSVTRSLYGPNVDSVEIKKLLKKQKRFTTSEEVLLFDEKANIFENGSVNGDEVLMESTLEELGEAFYEEVGRSEALIAEEFESSSSSSSAVSLDDVENDEGGMIRCVQGVYHTQKEIRTGHRQIDSTIGYEQLSKKLGKGLITYANGVRFLKEDSTTNLTKNGQPNGRGYYVCKVCGIRYDGEFKNGVPHGYGVIQISLKKDSTNSITGGLVTYWGSFYKGKRSGRGAMTSHNGAVYIDGYWQDDKLNGPNAVIEIDPEASSQLSIDVLRYEGEMEHGLFDGSGELSWKDGATYVGEFHNGKRHGAFGTMKDENEKVVLAGRWAKDLPEGALFPVYHLPDGKIYVGSLESGEKEGFGRLYENMAGGLIYEGTWKNNVPHGRGVLYARDGRYEGDFSRGIREGKGTFIFTSREGDVRQRQYEGDWRNDKRDGVGLYTAADGLQYALSYVKDRPTARSLKVYRDYPCSSYPSLDDSAILDTPIYGHDPLYWGRRRNLDPQNILLVTGMIGKGLWERHIEHSPIELLSSANPADWLNLGPMPERPPKKVSRVTLERKNALSLGGLILKSSIIVTQPQMIYKITIKKAQDLNSATIGIGESTPSMVTPKSQRLNPYVRVLLSYHMKKTKPHISGGGDPVWNKTLKFAYSPEQNIFFQVYHDNNKRDKVFLGAGVWELGRWLKTGEKLFDGDVILYRSPQANDKISKIPAGRLWFSLELVPKGNDDDALSEDSYSPRRLGDIPEELRRKLYETTD